MNRLQTTLLAAAAAGAAGCTVNDVTLAPQPGSLVRTTHSAYTVPANATQLTIPARVTNNTGSVLLLDGAGRDFSQLEKQVGREWQPVYHAVYTMQWVEPIRLAPGETRDVNIWLSLTPGATPRLDDAQGTYRALFGFGRESGEPDRIAAYTNTFDLVPAGE